MTTKIYKNIYALSVLCLLSGAFVSCSDFIDVEPQGVISEELAMSEPDKMVTSAYAKLGDDWYTYPFNLWPYGDLTSDDSYKGGSGTTDTLRCGTICIAPSAVATVHWFPWRNMATNSMRKRETSAKAKCVSFVLISTSSSSSCGTKCHGLMKRSIRTTLRSRHLTTPSLTTS